MFIWTSGILWLRILFLWSQPPILFQNVFFLNFGFMYLFIYLWLRWVLVSVRGLSLVAASGGHSSSRCAGLSLSWPLLLWGTGSRRAGSVAVAHRPSRSAACGILPDQWPNPCPLHWQADPQPLRHQRSPRMFWTYTSLYTPIAKIRKQYPCTDQIKYNCTYIISLIVENASERAPNFITWPILSSWSNLRKQTNFFLT